MQNKDVYIVRAFWDGDANVWCASGVNFIGLATEGESVDVLLKKIPPMISDLEEANEELSGGNIPIQLLVDASIRREQRA